MVSSDHLPDQVKFPDWSSANNSDCRVCRVINKIRRLRWDDKCLMSRKSLLQLLPLSIFLQPDKFFSGGQITQKQTFLDRPGALPLSQPTASRHWRKQKYLKTPKSIEEPQLQCWQRQRPAEASNHEKEVNCHQ